MLKGKNALVTGSTGGMGLGIASVLASHGCNVMTHGFGEAATIRRLCGDLSEKHGVKVQHDSTDLMKTADIAKMIDGVERAFGSIDILVNNAGIQHVAPVDEFPVERWDALLTVNLSAAFHAIRTAVPKMRARGWGRIVNTASSSGLKGSPNKSAYCASKFGIIGLTKSVALEVAGSSITCNAICPGWVLSGMSRPQIEVIAQRDGVSFEEASKTLLGRQPMKRFIKPEEVGGLVAYLCSDAAAAITGATMSIDGGITAS
ncbi:MAG: 3-hydroxybutyrate dehydrogenase [Alphaproteobacteria bacterium]